MRAVCIDQPISWLRLERHRLGELPRSESLAIEQHLVRCPTCRRCYEETGIERELAPLPDLSEMAAANGVYGPRAGFLISRLDWLRGWRVAALALTTAAAALLLWVRTEPSPLERQLSRPASLSVKGGTLVLQVVRKRGNAVSRDGEIGFLPGDTFKLLVTSPLGLASAWSVVVYQDEAAYFPLALAEKPTSGNRVPLPGAVALDGESPAWICVAFGDAETVALRRLERGPERLPETAACVLALPESAATGSN